MKILKYLVLLIAVLVLLVLAVGFIHPEVDYGSEITVSKSVEESWAVSQDESKLALWLEGFKSMELISGEKGAVGSKYKIVVNPSDGQEDFEMIETVVSVKEYDHISMEFDSDMMGFRQTILFKKNGEGTTITTESKVLGKGMMMRSMFALMEMTAGAFGKQETKNMEALKKVIEENTADYSPVAIEAKIQEIEAIDEEVIPGGAEE